MPDHPITDDPRAAAYTETPDGAIRYALTVPQSCDWCGLCDMVAEHGGGVWLCVACAYSPAGQLLRGLEVKDE